MKYNEIKIGDKAEIVHTITKDDIEKFVELTGDDNKIHVDEAYSKNTEFKKPVAHGMLGASFISTIIGTKIPGDGALWFSQTLEFLIPVRVADTITIKAEVINKIDRQKIVELKTDIFNQYKQKVTKGVAKVKVIEELVVDKNVEAKIHKTVLVIGATGGIGYSCAIDLAKDGFDVIIHYNSNIEKVKELKNKIEKLGQKALIVQSDITDKFSIDNMFLKIERDFTEISAFVNASTVKFGNIKFNDLEWKDIQKQIEINIESNFNLMKKLVPFMEKNKYGKIAFITTQYTERIEPEIIPYITAKSALNGFAKSLSIELAPKGIRVNLISPSMTDTELISDVPEKVKLVTIAKSPIKRLAKTCDVSQAVVYLLSNRSDFVTGETIRINGGQVMI